MKIKSLIFSAFCLAAFSLGAGQQGYAAAAENEYKTVMDIPEQLLGMMRAEMPREGYVSSVVAVVRANGENKQRLTQEDIDNLRIREEQKRRKNKLSSILEHDLNLDSKVTEEELRTSFARNRSARRIDQAVQSVMKSDTDNDGVITWAEMTAKTTDERSKSFAAEKLTRMLALDPDKDGALTAVELQKLAERAFDLVDMDKDTILSEREYKQAAKFLQGIRSKEKIMAAVPEGCNFPPVPKGAQVVVIAAQKGDISPIALEDAEQLTYVSYAEMHEEAPETYLILVSRDTTLWHMKAKSAQLTNIVLAGRLQRGTGKIAAGITGIAKEKVTFVPGDCVPALSRRAVRESSMDEASSALEAFLKVSLVGGGVVMQNQKAVVHKESVQVSDLNRPIGRAPAGFDKSVWEEKILLTDDRLAQLTPEAMEGVVSDGAIIPYTVLPKAFGLAQLVHQGILKPVANGQTVVVLRRDQDRGNTHLVSFEKIDLSNHSDAKVEVFNGWDYRIEKPLPAYPYDLRFFANGKMILTEGGSIPLVKAPVCIVSEDTGKPVEQSGDCR